MKNRAVPLEKLRAVCPDDDPSLAAYAADGASGERMIGQERAARALAFGLGIEGDGYNIFVSGIPGTGRTTSVEAIVREAAARRPTPDDWCYVHNFAHPDHPRLLRFPAGTASAFRRDMESLIQELKVEVPRAFESRLYEDHRNQILKGFQRKKEETFERFEGTARAASFDVKQTPTGIAFIPLVEGRPLEDGEMEKLTDEAREGFRAKREVLSEQLTEVLRKLRDEEKDVRGRLSGLERDTALYAVSPRIEDLKEKYAAYPAVVSHLDDVQRDLVENVDSFQEKKDQEVLPGLRMPGHENVFTKYEVNVLVDNGGTKGAPVVRELNPTVYNLSGKLEYRPQLGAMFTDFTMLKPGALHLANGGYLIVQALDVLRNYYAWETLKRAVKNREIAIEDLNEQFRLINTPSLKPEPVPIRVKVILIGSPLLYYLLHAYDEDFTKMFKVKADFTPVMDRNAEGISRYAAFVGKIVRDEGLAPVEPGAVAEIVEYGSRAAEDQTKLTTRFIEIADLVREAAYWAAGDGAASIARGHVRAALDEKTYRVNMVEKRLEEMIREGTIMVETEGARTGAVNGLSVLTMGDYSFGKPSRITAVVSPGRGGAVNIDREVKLAGTIHNKGFLILSGYFAGKFAAGGPLVFSASICFEQLYDELEGDSASSAETYALLSALSGVPINQGIAVTGSVSQHGQVQPVGGVNQKIEGFYYTCKARGLTGSQGVLIPAANVKNLMLNPEVTGAVAAGRFAVWAAATIDEGIEVLTGVPAGGRRKDGSYPPDSVNGRAARRLAELARVYLTQQDRFRARKPRRGGGTKRGSAAEG